MLELIPQSIPDVKLLCLDRFDDPRGYFGEVFHQKQFTNLGLPKFVQDNLSRSIPFVLRGLHYQLNPKAQAKLVACLNGRIRDVAVDIRKGSPYYGKWVSVELSYTKPQFLFIPEGFAHGFYNFGNEPAVVYYKTTNYFSKEHDRNIVWNDPEINIEWKLIDERFVVSKKDAAAPLLKDAEINFQFG